MRRSDHTPQSTHRATSRFYQHDDGWYYATREGQHGPFASRGDAEADARRYAGLHAHLENRRSRSDGAG